MIYRLRAWLFRKLLNKHYVKFLSFCLGIILLDIILFHFFELGIGDLYQGTMTLISVLIAVLIAVYQLQSGRKQFSKEINHQYKQLHLNKSNEIMFEKNSEFEKLSKSIYLKFNLVDERFNYELYEKDKDEALNLIIDLMIETKEDFIKVYFSAIYFFETRDLYKLDPDGEFTTYKYYINSHVDKFIKAKELDDENNMYKEFYAIKDIISMIKDEFREYIELCKNNNLEFTKRR